jgi:hypothetical protein
MKTRYEMIYEFMVALASNPNAFDLSTSDLESRDWVADEIVQMACKLADKYLEGA